MKTEEIGIIVYVSSSQYLVPHSIVIGMSLMNHDIDKSYTLFTCYIYMYVVVVVYQNVNLILNFVFC